MTMMRLLLPFTHGIDESAIIAVLVLAERFGATLVVLSLSCLPEASDTGPCWQDIQQSNDFLTFVLHKTARWGVPVDSTITERLYSLEDAIISPGG